MPCKPGCPKTVRAVAHVEARAVIVCMNCGGAHTPNHGLNQMELDAIVELARALSSKQKASSRSTTRKKGNDDA